MHTPAHGVTLQLWGPRLFARFLLGFLSFLVSSLQIPHLPRDKPSGGGALPGSLEPRLQQNTDPNGTLRRRREMMYSNITELVVLKLGVVQAFRHLFLLYFLYFLFLLRATYSGTGLCRDFHDSNDFILPNRARVHGVYATPRTLGAEAPDADVEGQM